MAREAFSPGWVHSEVHGDSAAAAVIVGIIFVIVSPFLGCPRAVNVYCGKQNGGFSKN